MRMIRRSLKKEDLLLLLVFIAVYSNILRVVLGKWATIISDIALIGIIVCGMHTNRGFKIRFNKRFGVIALCIVVLQINALLEILNPNILNQTYALIEYRKTIFQLLAVFIGYLLSSESTFAKNIKGILYISLPVILYGIKQYFLFSEIDKRFYLLQDASEVTYHYNLHVRAISIFSGPFHYGMLCSLILCFSLYLFFCYKEKRYLFYGIICMTGAFCSATRTNLVCCIIVVLMFVYYYVSQTNTISKIYKKGLLLTTLAMGVSVFLLNFVTFLDDRNVIAVMLDSIMNITDDTRFLGRTSTWKISLELIEKNIFWGNGIGSAGDTLVLHNISLCSVTPHNMFLKIFIELGLVGILVFVIFTFMSIKECFQMRQRLGKWFALSCCIVVGLNSLVGSTIGAFPVLTIFWVVIGMIFAANRKGD